MVDLRLEELQERLIKLLVEDYNLGIRQLVIKRIELPNTLPELVYYICGKTTALYHWGEIKSPEYLSRAINLSLKLYEIIAGDLGVNVRVFQPISVNRRSFAGLSKQEAERSWNDVETEALRYWGLRVRGTEADVIETREQLEDTRLMMASQIEFIGDTEEKILEFTQLIAQDGAKGLKANEFGTIEGNKMYLTSCPETITLFAKMVGQFLREVSRQMKIPINAEALKQSFASFVKELEIHPAPNHKGYLPKH